MTIPKAAITTGVHAAPSAAGSRLAGSQSLWGARRVSRHRRAGFQNETLPNAGPQRVGGGRLVSLLVELLDGVPFAAAFRGARVREVTPNRCAYAISPDHCRIAPSRVVASMTSGVSHTLSRRMNL